MQLGAGIEIHSKPGEKIAAYSWHPFQYIVSERLPISGAFVFMPWQAKYNENPIFGIKIDPCVDLKAHKPKVMMVDKLYVFNLAKPVGGVYENGR